MSLSAGSRKAEAAEELEISLSTLDRKIGKGEVEVVRECTLALAVGSHRTAAGPKPLIMY